MNYCFTLIAFLISATLFAQQIPEKYNDNQTVTWQEAIDAYTLLAKKHEQAKLLTYGNTDIGKPLHLFVISADKDFDATSIHQKDKRVVLINNGIHPGEPCGVDASIKLADELLSKPKNLPKNTVIAIIPLYNVGGSLNRGCCSRANQNGPEEHGFRGNARNLDLNRDFIKCDSKNAQAFTTIFQEWYPDVFIDTHTSNGADYQYVMTLITTQLDKLHPIVAKHVKEQMLPVLNKAMEGNKYPMAPYVNSIKGTPDNGISDYLETPRYSTGYSTLFNTIGFTTETHMFKPFKERVLSTYYFLKEVIAYTDQNSKAIGTMRSKANEAVKTATQFPVDWEIDTTSFETISFNGYEAEYKESNVTPGHQRLFYNREKPFTKDIRYYNKFSTKTWALSPKMYVIPQAWAAVIDRLKWNKVNMKQLAKDTILTVEVYRIADYDTRTSPYEGHYLHHSVKGRPEMVSIQYYKGDYVVPVNQIRNRYIVETLEPQSVDSYFNWNFFDEILQQKEWFSSYIFEEEAEAMLKNDADLKKKFEARKKADKEFAGSRFAQLYFLYQNSKHYEPTHMRYPIGRIKTEMKLPLVK
jgi:hypothetical protein